MHHLLALDDVPDNMTKIWMGIITVILAFIAWQSKEIHKTTNSNLTRMSDAIEAEALARGKREERADADSRRDPPRRESRS